MSKLIVFLILFFALLVFSYLLICFTLWEFNPYNWGIKMRLFMLTIPVAIALIIASLSSVD